MSLINQMLSDLETRRGAALHESERALEGVHAVPAERSSRSGSVLFAQYALTAFIGVGAAGIAWFGLQMGAASAHSQTAAQPAERKTHTSPVETPSEPGDSAQASELITAPVTVEKTAVQATAALMALQPALSPDGLALAEQAVQEPGSTQQALFIADLSVAAAPPEPVASATAPNDSSGVAESVATQTPATSLPAHDAIETRGTVHVKPTRTPPGPRDELAAIQRRLRLAPGDYAELAGFVAAHPKLLPARTALAMAYLRAGRQESAEVLLRESIDLAPNETGFRLMLAHLLVDRGEPLAALNSLSELPPGVTVDGEFKAFVAALFQRLGQHDDAIENYREALTEQPARGAWWIGLGISLSAGRQTEPAQQAFQRALADRQLSDNLRRYAHREIGRLDGSG